MSKIRRLSCVVLGLSAAVAALSAQTLKSPASAKDLVTKLEAAKLEAVAVRLGEGPDSFAAAMYSPGVLMVVTGRYASPPLLDERIAKKDFKEAYVDLQSAATAGSRMFVQDIGADGLKAKTMDNVEVDGKTVVFDGQWKKQKFASEADYQKQVSDLDDRYAKAIGALAAALK